MKPITRLLGLSLAMISGLFSTESVVASEELPKPPNIIMVLADDQGFRDSGAYGNEDVKTPNIDRLASEGLVFDLAFTATAMCAPTRQQLYTGLYPVNSGAYPQNSFVRDGTRSIPHYFDELRYRTGISGKRHYAPASAFPFESLNDPATAHDKESPDMERIAEFINRDAEQPFFLVVTSRQPHTPWNRGDVHYDPDSLTVPPDMVDTPETRRALADYYREVSDFDAELGQVIDLLDESGQADNTLFIYTSEQGAMFPGGKWSLYDDGVRTALVMRWPGVVPAGRTDALVAYVDVVPTLVELAGGTPPEVDGSSFANVVRSGDGKHRDHVFGVHTNLGICNGVPYPIRSVRDSRYKLILNGNSDQVFRNNITERDAAGYFASWRDAAGQGDPVAKERVAAFLQRPAVEFYDLQRDPHELNNLADDPEYARKRSELRAVLDEWLEQQGDQDLMITENAALQHMLPEGVFKLSTPKCRVPEAP